MDLLLKVAFYAVSTVSGLVITGLFLANLYGQNTAGEDWRHKVILLVAALCGVALL